MMSKETDEWYTPEWLVKKIQAVLDPEGKGIFDPCY